MQEGQELTVTLDANELHSRAEKLEPHAIASRLSEAIIDTVSSQKAQGWAMSNMEFNSGVVTIHFRKPQKRTARKGRSTAKTTPTRRAKSRKKGTSNN